MKVNSMPRLFPETNGRLPSFVYFGAKIQRSFKIIFEEHEELDYFIL